MEAAQKNWTITDIAHCTEESDGHLGMWTCPLLDVIDKKMDMSSMLVLA